MIFGTRAYSPLRSGALASASSWVRHARFSSGRMTLTIGTACEVGSTPAVSRARSVSMYARMPLSCSRMRSSSASVSARRDSRATCSTSCREIMLELLQLRVLQRQALAPDAGEADGHDDVAAVALHAHHHALAESRVPHARADLDRPRLLLRLVARHLARRHRYRGRRLLHAPGVERLQPVLGHLAQEAR